MITGAIITNTVIQKSRGQQSLALETSNGYMLSLKQWSKLIFSDLTELYLHFKVLQVTCVFRTRASVILDD